MLSDVYLMNYVKKIELSLRHTMAYRPLSDLRHHDDDVNGFVRAAHALMKQVNVSDGRHVGEAGDVPTRRTDDASNMTQVDNDVSYVENQGNRDLRPLLLVPSRLQGWVP